MQITKSGFRFSFTCRFDLVLYRQKICMSLQKVFPAARNLPFTSSNFHVRAMSDTRVSEKTLFELGKQVRWLHACMTCTASAGRNAERFEDVKTVDSVLLWHIHSIQ
ncbi:uncharacterized protein V6R79_002645 [Siganus canaliculatus]